MMKIRMVKYKKIYLISAILIMMFVFPSLLNVSFSNQGRNSNGIFNEETKALNLEPKSSAGEISIITPENKTYAAPMSGYYPGTHSFEDVLVGGDPKGWTDQSGSGTTAQIIASCVGHNKVYEFYDGSSSQVSSAYNLFSRVSNGTIEWWERSTDVTKSSRVLFSAFNYFDISLGTNIQYLYMLNNVTAQTPTLCAASPNTWYHIRVDFECTNGGYMGLSQYQCYIYVNDVQYGAYPMSTLSMGIYGYSFYSGSTNSGFTSYIDAVGYSWDPNYNIGDNKKEGLLLSYTNTTNLAWKGYSLDGQANATISGNKTIPMQNDGLHAIQVFGNNSAGTMYCSEKRYFTVNTTKQINIITPENKTYTSTMSGYYPGTYGFESDAIGTTPKGWTQEQTAGSAYVVVAADEVNHSNIMRIQEMTTYQKSKNTFSTTQTSGTVEFWVKFPVVADSDKDCYIKIYQSGDSDGIRFGLENSALQYYDGSWHSIQSLNIEQWYHIRIEFESGSTTYQGLSADTWNIYVDGVKKSGSGYPYIAANIGMNTMEFYTISAGWMHFHVDAVSYSWDSSYTIGDNMNEGLLLTFNNNTNLNWMGYSLDGQANRTIYGDTTINIPSNGEHSIQAFGNDSEGLMISSEKRYFTVDYWDTIAPTIAGPNGEITLEQFDSYTIQWNITEINGGTYKITQNLVEIDSGPFNNWDNVSWIANTTMLGDINYTITATDPSKNNGTRSILIHVVDTTDPEILDLTSDFPIFQGQTASFSWRILEHNPANYAIYDNATLVKSLTAYQNDTLITYSFLNWTIGQHNFEIRAYDSQGHMSPDQITVTVLARPSQYRFLIPNAITCIDWISTYGLYIEFSANASGFLEMHRMTSIFSGIDEVKINNLEIFYFYNFTIYDADLTENESIIENVLIRFYYNPSQVKNPSNLRLYHYIFDIANIIWVWKMCDFTINETAHYIELNSTAFSIFALVEYKLPPGNDDDTTDTKHNKDLIAIIFGDYLVLVVLGAAIGLAVPSAYVIKSRKKKKETAITDLKEKAKMKRESLLKAGKVSKTGDSTIIKKEPSAKSVIPAVSKEPVKAKKAKLVEKPVEEKLNPEQLKEIQKTEEEMSVQVKKDVCTVHKSPIQGINYTCPKCQAKYCLRCAQTLESNNEGCWVCDTPINASTVEHSVIATDNKLPTAIPSIKDSKGFVENEYFIDLINGKNGSNRYDLLKGYEFTVMSKELLEKINKFAWDEKQKQDFISEMLALSPEEREKIIDHIEKNDEILRKKKENSLK